MKVLQFVAYGTISGRSDFSRNQSGYGYMVVDIASAIAALGHDVDLLSQSYFTDGFTHRKVSYLQRKPSQLLKDFRVSDLANGLRRIVSCRLPLKARLRIPLYWLSLGFVVSKLRSKHYDVVHVHGITEYTWPVIRWCVRNDFPMVVTLHGLYTFDSVPHMGSESPLEKGFLRLAYQRKLPVSVISSGISKRIRVFLDVAEAPNFQVVVNGVENKALISGSETPVRSVRAGEGLVTVLCVGNISERKNQVQVLDALQALPAEILDSMEVLFFGKDYGVTPFQVEIDSRELGEVAIYMGEVEREALHDYYLRSHCTILAAKTEGFGLSVIESYVYGKPCIFFSDIDAAKEFFSPDVAVMPTERSTKALAAAIVETVQKQWDEKLIRNYAFQFSMENVASRYADMLRSTYCGRTGQQ